MPNFPSVGSCLRRLLDLIEAGLVGAIPKSTGISDLTALTFLSFSANPAITKVPYFGNFKLKKLECVLYTCSLDCSCWECRPTGLWDAT
jgi:hypothetical protein